MEPVYHIPAMLKETLDALSIQKNGLYVDLTFGGGGHSRAIMERLGPNGRLYSMDQDQEAQQNAIDDKRWHFIHGNFRYLDNYLDYYNLSEVDSDGVGYVVNVEGISSENYDFSPTLSALLTVAGSDSQSGNGGNNNQEPAVTANVTITANANDAQMGSVTGGGTYVQGASVTLTATANSGYHFVSWSNGRTTASITVTADADATYTATFAADGQGGSGDNSGMDG